MLDIKVIRNNPEIVKQAMKKILEEGKYPEYN